METATSSVYRFVVTNKWKVDLSPNADHKTLTSEPQQQQLEEEPDERSYADKMEEEGGNMSSSQEEEYNEEYLEQKAREEADVNSAKKEASQYAFELLNEHCIQERNGQKAYRCDVCDGIYRHAFSLKRHFLRTHVNYIYLSSSDISNCNVNLSSSEEAARSEFIRRFKSSAAQNENPPPKVDLYRCNTCTQLFDVLDDLKYHIVHHPNNQTAKRFACNQCNMTFSHKQNLVRHLSVHSGEKPYTCKHCGKGFPTATNQRRHERIHEGLKPYICSHCASHFSQSGDLKKHIRKLHEGYFHPCAFCLKYFSALDQLREHCLSHGKTLEMNERALKRKAVETSALDTVDVRNNVVNNNNNNVNSNSGSSYYLICFKCSTRFTSRMTFVKHDKVCPGRFQNQESLSNVPSEDEQPQYPFPTTNGGAVESQFVPSKYFSSVSENIAVNLQNYVDGKLSSHVYKPQASKQMQIVGVDKLGTDWSFYNFPPNFTETGNGDEVDGGSYQSDEMEVEKEIVEEEDELSKLSSEGLENGKSVDELSECQVLDLSVANNNNNNNNTTAVAAGSVAVEQQQQHSKEVSDVILDKMAWPMLYICHACGERFQTLSDINEHKINNHPNVYCTHLELESCKGAPAELFQYHCSPIGILQKCPVLSSTDSLNQQTPLRCTKCQNVFSGTVELHQHILACGKKVKSRVGEEREKRSCPAQLSKRGIKRNIGHNAMAEEAAPKKRRSSVRKELQVAAAEVKDVDQFRCLCCDSVFRNSSALERHQKLCLDGAPARNPHRCRHCGRTFTYAASLKKHMLEVCAAFVAKQKKRNNMIKGSSSNSRKMKRNRLNFRNRKVLAVKILKDKQIKLTRHVSILNPKVLEKMSAVSAVDPPPSPPKQEPEPQVTAPSSPPAAVQMADEPVVEEKEEKIEDEPVEEAELVSKMVDEVVVVEEEDFKGENVEAEEAGEVVQAEEESKQDTIEQEQEFVKVVEAPPSVADEKEETLVVLELVLELPEEDQMEVEKVEDVDKALEAVPSVETASAEVAEVSTVEENAKENDSMMAREQQHTCPNCKRTFTYLANFKKHLNHLCPLRQLKKDVPGAVAVSAAADSANCEANKENNDKEMASKVKENVVMEVVEAEVPSARSKSSSPQSCNVCHKTFSSYLVMWKHRLSHKLKTSEKDGEGEKKMVKEAAAVVVTNKKLRPRISTSSVWMRGGKRRKKRGVARRLRGGKKIVSAKKQTKLKDISEDDDDEEVEEEEDEDDDEEGTLVGDQDEDLDEDLKGEDDVKDDEVVEAKQVVMMKATRSKTTFIVNDGGIKKGNISEYRKTILRKVNESVS